MICLFGFSRISYLLYSLFGIDGFCFVEGWDMRLMNFGFGRIEVENVMSFCLIGLDIVFKCVLKVDWMI